MSLTNFPHGVSSFGSPLTGPRFGSPWATHYFVDGIDGADGNTGLTPSTAFATIQKAVTVSAGGDVIYIRPKKYTMGTGFARYTEDVTVEAAGTAGSGQTVPNARKSIIGVSPLGVASDFLGVRWKFATATNLNVEAAGTHIENIGFFAEGATYGVYFEGDGSTYGKNGHTGSSLYNCSIKGEGGVRANGSDSLQIIKCQFQAKSDGTVCGMIITTDGTNVCRRPVLRGCHFIGGNGTAMSAAPIIWTGGVADGLIADNDFGLGTSVQINIATASTGLITRNFFAEADLSTTFIVQNGMVCVANWDLTGIQETA
jgi:hypothetical protein